MARRAMIQQLCAQARTSKETVSGAQQPCWLYSRCNEYKQAEKSLHRHVTDDVRVGWSTIISNLLVRWCIHVEQRARVPCLEDNIPWSPGGARAIVYAAAATLVLA